jgi:putative DNA methylase
LVDDPSAHSDRFPTEEAQDAERQRLFRIIERLVPWEASGDENVLEEAKAEIRACYPDGLPTIIDPFCGGGAIPLEALRLGLPVKASDLNPVAVLTTKALIELPSKFEGRQPMHPTESGNLDVGTAWKKAAGLAEDVRWYGAWIRQEAEKRIGHLYPKANLPDGSKATVIAWLWSRTVTCPNPACGATIPLVRSFWLGQKRGKETWVQPIPDPAAKRVRFEIGHGSAGPPVEGTVERNGARCLVCQTPVPLTHVRFEGRAGRMGIQLMAVVAEGHRQRIYMPPDAVHESAAQVDHPDNLPDTELPEQALGFRVQGYGMTHHADLFTSRQLTALCTISDLVEEARIKVLADSGGDESYACAVATYLAFAADSIANLNSSLASWRPQSEAGRSTFARQALPMVWDFVEVNPVHDKFHPAIERVADVVASVPMGNAKVTQVNAMDQTSTGLVSTDPPYYDNVGYADLSDFFYVWLRRSLRQCYPQILSTILTPKTGELVADPFRFGGDVDEANRFFETGFEATFAKLANDDGHDAPLTVYYAFKQSEEDEAGVASTGWETMLAGMMGAGLSVTATWPMRTEAANRMRNQASNALASSIILACRRRSVDAGITDRRGFQQVLKGRLARDLRLLQSGGIAPVDLAQAAIGPGMAVFSSYAKVVESDGSAMSVRRALALINQILDEVTAEQEGEFDEDTRWAIAWYSEFGMDEGPYGRADDLSRAKNVSVDGLSRAGIVKASAGKVRLRERAELDPDWDPVTDERLTVWEVTQQLTHRLLDDGEASAAKLLSRVGGLGDAARDLAYRLFQIAESKKWAKEAGPYNALAAAWPELTRLAAAGPMGQGSLQI